MKTALLTIFIMTAVTTPVFAKDKTDINSSSFAVEKMICSKIYVPATGAAPPTYQAGVDVNGNAVAPADIASVPSSIPDYIEVPMTIDLAQKLGAAPAGAEMALPVANLKLYKDGRVEYNGQDITSNAGALCGVAQKSDAKSANEIMPAAGQDKMMSAPSLTTPQQPSVAPAPSSYVAPIQPEEMTPQPGSVAASSTTPPPKIIYKLQQGTAAKSLGQ